MFEKYLIVEDSLRNVDGGFAFDARLGYYRGLGLSMIEELAVCIDGFDVPRDAIRFDEGKGPLSLAEMETAYDRRWGFGDVATITVQWPEPLAPGGHRLSLTEQLRISYMPFPSIRRDEKELALTA
jgi:hypothetical protein